MIVYRLYIWSFVLLFVGALGLAFFSPSINDGVTEKLDGVQSVLFNFFSITTGVAFFTTIILFLFNIGLILKLWRIARVRNRLGLAGPLESAFKERRRHGRVLNFVTGFLVVLGAAYVLMPAMFAVSEMELSVILITAPFFLLFGITLLSLHFLRRGMERLQIVENLHGELESGSQAESDTAVPLDDASYEILAHLERSQIMEERQQSIARASSDRGTFGYALQMSFESQESKDRFPSVQRQLIDQKILELMSNPGSCESEASQLPDSDYLKVSVKDADAFIQYRVDEASHRVQIARIMPTESLPGENK